MKNLFIMHTQYNLILSAAIISRNPEAENTLVLFSEFTVSDRMLDALKRVFDRVVVVRDKFRSNGSTLEEIREIRSCMKKVRELKDEKFDNIYMSQERIFDLILCTQAKKNNPQIWCGNVEEDAYYSVNEQRNADDYAPKESWKVKLCRWINAIMLWEYPYNYREIHYCYGMSREYDGVNLLFPYLARRELQKKELLEITKQELVAGIDAIYTGQPAEYPSGERYALFFFDLMGRYRDPDGVKEIVRELVRAAQKEGRTVLFKYHPRETDKFTDFIDVFEIPHLIPAEKVLNDLEGTDTVVVGNATTACIVAAKLDFRVISICKLEAPHNTKMHSVMEAIGISCIESASHIHSLK